MQRWDDSLSDHSGLAPSRSPWKDSLGEDQLDVIRPAKVQVFADDLFKEDAAVHWLVKNLCQRKLRLQNRKIVTIPRLTILRCEGMRQDSEPLSCQAINLLGYLFTVAAGSLLVLCEVWGEGYGECSSRGQSA